MTAIDTTSRVLPRLVDLRPGVDRVENQGQEGGCYDHAGTSFIEVQAERAHDKWPDLIPATGVQCSRHMLEYLALDLENRIGEEGIISIENVMRAMWRGVCDEALWPYVPENRFQRPPLSCFQAAQAFRVMEYASLIVGSSAGDWELTAPATIQSVCHALAQGRPVQIAFKVTKDFITQWNLKHDWKTWDWDEVITEANPLIGGHAVLVIGYKINDDGSTIFLCQNSWGPEGADGGFFGMPDRLFKSFGFGVSQAFCSIRDTIGFVPVDDYLPMQWDQPRADAIRSFMTTKMQEVTKVATLKDVHVNGAEMDAAMKALFQWWEAGTAARWFNI